MLGFANCFFKYIVGKVVKDKVVAGVEGAFGAPLLDKDKDRASISKFLREHDSANEMSVESNEWFDLVLSAKEIIGICVELKQLLTEITASRILNKVSSLWYGVTKPMSDGSDILSEETKQYLAKKGIRPRSSVTRYFRAATTWFLGDNIYKSSIIDFDLQSEQFSKLVDSDRSDDCKELFLIVDLDNYWLYNVNKMKIGYMSVWGEGIRNFVRMLSSKMKTLRDNMLDCIESDDSPYLQDPVALTESTK